MAYEVTDGESMIRNMHGRIGRTERGSVKNKVPLVEVPPDVEVEGARFYVHAGQLCVRIGTSNFLVNLTPL